MEGFLDEIKKHVYVFFWQNVGYIQESLSFVLLFAFLLFRFCFKKKKKRNAFFIRKHFEGYSLNTGKHIHQQLYDRAALN